MSAETQHRAACISQALEDGYLDSIHDVNKWDICDDGQFHLKANSNVWFSTHVSLSDYLS